MSREACICLTMRFCNVTNNMAHNVLYAAKERESVVTGITQRLNDRCQHDFTLTN